MGFSVRSTQLGLGFRLLGFGFRLSALRAFLRACAPSPKLARVYGLGFRSLGFRVFGFRAFGFRGCDKASIGTSSSHRNVDTQRQPGAKAWTNESLHTTLQSPAGPEGRKGLNNEVLGFPDSSHAGSSFGESMIVRYPKPYPEGRSGTDLPGDEAPNPKP